MSEDNTAVTRGELREAARCEFWAFLERQAEWQAKRAVACRGVDPVSRKTVAEATAELAMITAARPRQQT